MTISAIDVAGLPAPDVIEEVDFERMLAGAVADLVARFPAIAGVIGLESEPARKLLETDAFREALLRARINDAARSQLLAFATGADLDHLAAFYDVIRLSGESDDRLRSRVVFTIAGRSTGGTATRYRAAALTASVEVKDAIVYTEGVSPVVHVAILATGETGVPSPAVLAAVSDSLNSSEVRMVNDTLNIRSAVTQTVAIEADVWLLPTAEMLAFDNLSAALRAAYASEGGLGFDFTHAWLIARLMQPGVQRVEILAPAWDIEVEGFEAVALGEIKLNYKGRSL